MAVPDITVVKAAGCAAQSSTQHCGVAGQSFSRTIRVNSGAPILEWEVFVGDRNTWPPGLSVSGGSTSGTVSGTPSALGHGRIRARNADGWGATHFYVVNCANIPPPQPPVITPPEPEPPPEAPPEEEKCLPPYLALYNDSNLELH